MSYLLSKADNKAGGYWYTPCVCLIRNSNENECIITKINAYVNTMQFINTPTARNEATFVEELKTINN